MRNGRHGRTQTAGTGGTCPLQTNGRQKWSVSLALPVGFQNALKQAKLHKIVFVFAFLLLS